MPEIVKWADIRDQFSDGLLLGNGASVAIHDGFKYESLYQAAQSNGHLSPEVIQIFNAFDTTDFEFVLRSLWQAQLVNKVLDIEGVKVEDAYRETREALIATVRDCHVSYDDALPHLTPIYQYMQQFKTVLSLNYDLVVYWAMMAGNEELGPWFKDAFVRNSFRENWEEVREPYGAAVGSSIVVYPHGNLVLVRNAIGNEAKLSVRNSPNLLNFILEKWEEGGEVPLFVSEGTPEEKRRTIESSSYLHRIYREVIPKVGSTLVIYGWSASEQDKHILNQLKLASIQKVAISVYHEDREFIARAKRLFTETGVEDVLFFDAESDGCWNYPESKME